MVSPNKNIAKLVLQTRYRGKKEMIKKMKNKITNFISRLGHSKKWVNSFVQKCLLLKKFLTNFFKPMGQANNNRRESNKPYIIVKTTDFDYVIPTSVNVFIDNVEKILEHYPNQRIRLETGRVLYLKNITPSDVENFCNLEYVYWVVAWDLITCAFFDLDNQF